MHTVIYPIMSYSLSEAASNRSNEKATNAPQSHEGGRAAPPWACDGCQLSGVRGEAPGWALPCRTGWAARPCPGQRALRAANSPGYSSKEREEESGTPWFAPCSATTRDIYLLYWQLVQTGGKPG